MLKTETLDQKLYYIDMCTQGFHKIEKIKFDYGF